MTKNEWDKCFTWLVESFQNWTPSTATSSIWYEEFCNLSPQEFKIAARSARDKHVSAFPPSVSQILAELKPKENPELLAQEAWFLALWNHPEQMDQTTLRAFRALGSPSNLHLMQNEEVKWIEKKFIKLWVACKESEQSEEVLTQIENQKFTQLAGQVAMVRKL